MPFSSTSSEAAKEQPVGPAPGPGEAPPGSIISPDTRRENRIPPGQARTRKWPVLHWGETPVVDRATWSLELTGLVRNRLRFSWDDFQRLPRVRVFADFHCVTRWSRLGNVWEGVSVRELLRRAEVRPEVTHVIAHGYDGGFTTNMPFDEFDVEDAIVADLHDGAPLSADHGGPVRLIVPRLYAWKSCKWLKAIDFSPFDQPGLWERGGYHDHGDPWTEERFRR